MSSYFEQPLSDEEMLRHRLAITLKTLRAIAAKEDAWDNAELVARWIWNTIDPADGLVRRSETAAAIFEPMAQLQQLKTEGASPEEIDAWIKFSQQREMERNRAAMEQHCADLHERLTQPGLPDEERTAIEKTLSELERLLDPPNS